MPAVSTVARQVRARQVRARQVRARQVRARQVRARQVRVRQVRARQVRARAVGFASAPGLMLREDLGELRRRERSPLRSRFHGQLAAANLSCAGDMSIVAKPPVLRPNQAHASSENANSNSRMIVGPRSSSGFAADAVALRPITFGMTTVSL